MIFEGFLVLEAKKQKPLSDLNKFYFPILEFVKLIPIHNRILKQLGQDIFSLNTSMRQLVNVATDYHYQDISRDINY